MRACVCILAANTRQVCAPLFVGEIVGSFSGVDQLVASLGRGIIRCSLARSKGEVEGEVEVVPPPVIEVAIGLNRNRWELSFEW